jgi:hypothetical protein
MKMREVVGAFGSFSKLSEALEELCSEGKAHPLRQQRRLAHIE